MDVQRPGSYCHHSDSIAGQFLWLHRQQRMVSQLTASIQAGFDEQGLSPSLLNFAPGLHQPDRLQFPFTVSIVHIMQVDGGINMAREQLDATPNVQRTTGWQRSLLPRQNTMFISSWPLGDPRQVFWFRHPAVGG